jgi:hypothetical protein
MSKEAMQQALEALQIADNIAMVGSAYTPRSVEAGLGKVRDAITALREALAQPAQPTRSEKMRAEGFTRRPARSWPLDGDEPAQPLTIKQEREAFEKWAAPITALAKENGKYVEVMTSLAFEAWQARASYNTTGNKT